MTLIGALAGAGVGAGIWLVAACVAGPHTAPFQGLIWRVRAVHALRLRLGVATVCAFVALTVTRWPTAVIAGGALGWFSPELFGSSGRRRASVDRSMAVAGWAEMLRDTLSASAGLEEAIVTTAPLVAPNIRPALSGLISHLGRIRLADALTDFANDLADPTADLVVSALILAARGEAQNLVELLGSLAEAAREDAEMRLRVEASRARVRTSVRVIAIVTTAMVVGLVAFDSGYLRPFDAVAGQLVLAFVFLGFAGGLTWLNAMSRHQAPDRFLAPREARR